MGCSAQPSENGPLGKPPALPSTSALSRPVALRVVTLALSELQRRYTQYECGHLQPLF
jgi:hypothetical protein